MYRWKFLTNANISAKIHGDNLLKIFFEKLNYLANFGTFCGFRYYCG